MSAPILKWFKTFNLTAFNNTALTSRTQSFGLENIGDVSVMITKGNFVSVVFNGKMFPINLNSKNPFVFEGYGVYLDANNDIWIGYPNT